MSERIYSAFEVYGVEIETMIVDAQTLDVAQIADEALRDLAGSSDWVDDVPRGVVCWSNELVAHVVEMKCDGPTTDLGALVQPFQEEVRWLDGLLRERGARLMPSAMHPWMDPRRETRLWPHDGAEVYRAYDDLFDCHQHGWANLQSTHLNLPFADEREFAALMAAVRLVLPMIPALCASSPFVEGAATDTLDNRLVYCRENAPRAPKMAGDVVPEAIYDIAGYRRDVLAPIARELAGIGAADVLLAREWTNARGAIARFDRMAIEVRVIDAQECPAADLAACAAVAAVVRALFEQRWVDTAAQQRAAGGALRRQLEQCTQHGPAAIVAPELAALLGVTTTGRLTAGELWRDLVGRTFDGPATLRPFVQTMLAGTLSERLLTAHRERELHDVYEELCDCLVAGRSFQA